MPFSRTDTIARKFLWRALPLSALLMAAIWAAAAVFVERTIRAEGERIVARAAAETAMQVRNHLTAVIEAARILSRNELLIGGLLDESGRAFVVPAFMRSLRLPDVSNAGFLLLDYAGTAVAASGLPIPEPHQRLLPPGDSESLGLSAEGLRAAFPVRYGASTEGYFVTWIPGAALRGMLAPDASSQLGAATIRMDNEILYEGCCATDGAGAIRSARLAVEEFPGLSVELLIDRSTLFPVAFQLNWFLLGAFAADLLVLLIVSLFAAAAAAEPLRRMVREIRQSPQPESLRLEGYDSAPLEIRFLAGTFNAAATQVAAETRQRQEALRQAEAHAERNALLATVIEHSSNGITISDARAGDHPLVYANPAFFRMTGYEPAEVIGRNCRFLNEKSAAPEQRKLLREAVSAGREIQIEIRNLRKDGSDLWNLLSLYPVRDSSGAVSHVIGVQIDVSEQRRIRDTMSRTSHLTSLGEMATGLAHELNQPLNVIRLASINLSSQLGGMATLPHTVGDKLGRIQRNVDRAVGIIEHMKVFGRGDAGPPAPFRLRDALEGALQIVGSELRNAGIDIRHAGTLDPMARGKPLTVEQVVINLALNARDAILAQRTGSASREDWIEFRLDARDGMAVLSVEDTGGGVPEEMHARIFEPFFTTKPVGKGTGLGLSVSFGIAAELGGSLTVRNASRGARFELRLPLAATAQPGSCVPSPAGAGA